MPRQTPNTGISRFKSFFQQWQFEGIPFFVGGRVQEGLFVVVRVYVFAAGQEKAVYAIEDRREVNVGIGAEDYGLSADFLQDPYVSGPFGFPGCGYTYYRHVGNEVLTDGSR